MVSMCLPKLHVLEVQSLVVYWELRSLGYCPQKIHTGHQWLMPIILVTQEAEIRRTAVRSQTQANSPGDPISKKKKHHETGLAEWLK
jgi:hypothetical protein